MDIRYLKRWRKRYLIRWEWVQGFGHMIVVLNDKGEIVDKYNTVQTFIAMALLREGRILAANIYKKRKGLKV